MLTHARTEDNGTRLCAVLVPDCVSMLKQNQQDYDRHAYSSKPTVSAHRQLIDLRRDEMCLFDREATNGDASDRERTMATGPNATAPSATANTLSSEIALGRLIFTSRDIGDDLRHI